MKELVAINGHITSPEEAKISVFDRGFLYGDGVYEVARSYDRVFFALEDHIERLFNSAERIYLDLETTPDKLLKEIYKVYKKSETDNAYMRIVVTRGEGRINLDPTQKLKPNFVIFIQELPKIPAEHYAQGINIITASVQRNPKESLDPHIKSGNYLNNVMALAEARRQKAQDAVMVNREGQITEGTTWNIYFVKGNEIVTPPDKADILLGITRKTLKKIIKEKKYKLTERYFKPEELISADEVFTSSSVKEVMPIQTVDRKTIGNGAPGKITKSLMVDYKDYVRNYCENFK